MNKDRRRKLNGIIDKLSLAQNHIEEIIMEEEEALDNLPENLRDSERGEVMHNAIDCLQVAIDNIDEAVNNIEEAQN